MAKCEECGDTFKFYGFGEDRRVICEDCKEKMKDGDN